MPQPDSGSHFQSSYPLRGFFVSPTAQSAPFVQLEELKTTKVFGGDWPLASPKTLDDITRVAFAYRVVGGKAYVARAFAATKK